MDNLTPDQLDALLYGLATLGAVTAIAIGFVILVVGLQILLGVIEGLLFLPWLLFLCGRWLYRRRR